MSALLILLILPALSHAADVPPPPLELSTPLPDGGHLSLLAHPGIVEQLIEGDNVTVRILHQISNYSGPVKLRLRSTDSGVIAIIGPNNFTLTVNDSISWPSIERSNTSDWDSIRNSTAGIKVSLLGMFLGRASIVFEVENKTSGDWMPLSSSLKVSVIRRLRLIDSIFTGLTVSLVMFANLGMGTKIDLSVVRKVLRRPLAPLIGFVSQYTIMPLVAFGVGALLDLPPGIRLGYFAMGCAPGGGGSNFYSYLLGGDVSLSITMTLVSTAAALGMIPLWLMTLGQFILQSQEYKVTIPFENILVSLVTMMVPLVIGYVIQLKLPKVAKYISIALKPFVLFLLIFFFTVGIYANLYIFRLFTPIVILAGCLLPYCGFFFGGLVAFLARLKLSFVKTVAIETGIQNAGVPVILMKFSLPQPDSDMAIVGPVAASMFTPVPLLILVFAREIYRRWCKKKKKEEDDDAPTEGDQTDKESENLNEVEVQLLEKEGEKKEDDEEDEAGDNNVAINGRKSKESLAKDEEEGV